MRVAKTIELDAQTDGELRVLEHSRARGECPPFVARADDQVPVPSTPAWGRTETSASVSGVGVVIEMADAPPR